MTDKEYKQLVEDISKNVARLILPRMKRMIGESIDLKVKDFVFEAVMNYKEKQKSITEELIPEKKSVASIEETKKELAKRARAKAKSLKEKARAANIDDDTFNLIESAVDVEAEELERTKLQDQILTEHAGTIKASEVESGDVVLPEQINYSELLRDL
jgi:hypothetical protein